MAQTPLRSRPVIQMTPALWTCPSPPPSTLQASPHSTVVAQRNATASVFIGELPQNSFTDVYLLL